MDEIISNFDIKIQKINKDFELIKHNIKEQNTDVLEHMVDLNDSIDLVIEKLLTLKSFIFKNNLELLEYNDAKEIKQQIINEKINKIIKPLMLSLLLKFN